MWEQKHCVASLKQPKTEGSEICKSFDFGEALERVYPLLPIIFEKLYYEDLKATALVNNIWDKYSSDELQKRNRASWVSLSRPKVPAPQLVIEKSTNFKYDSTSFGLVFYNYHQIKLNKHICIHGDSVTRMTFAEYLSCEIIPQEKDFWVFSCSRIYCPKLHKEYDGYFTAVLIPEIPNINVKQFIVPCDKADSIFKKSISKDEHIHCVLVFTLSYPNLIIRKFTKELLNRANADAIAIGGGVIMKGIKPFQKDITKRVFKSNTLFCITLTQDRHKTAQFDAFSVVISDDIDFEAELCDFRNRIKLREHSFAFRICCAAKDAKDMETSVFNNVFPNTFLVGIDAEGEIGWNKFDCWEPEEDSPEAKKQKIRHFLCHQYTTIIVVMTWGKKIQVAD